MPWCDFLRPRDRRGRNPERDRHPDDTFDVSSAFVKGTFLLTPYFKRRIGKIKAEALNRFFEKLREEKVQPGAGIDIEGLILSRGEEPQHIASCLEELQGLPEVAVLEGGFSDLCIQLLTHLGEPVRTIEHHFNVGDIIHHQEVLVIPTGALDGLGRSLAFKRRLEEYVRAGGRVIVLCQFRGEDYGALPLNLDGFGWQEDQSCHNASMRIVMDHPVLSGQDSEFMDISCDGFFTQWPENAGILLRRAAHDRPCLLVYPFGKGQVIAGTMFIDWAFAHQQPTNDELTLMRDMVGFAKCKNKPPEYDPDDKEITLSVEVANPTDKTTASLRFILIDPDKNIKDETPVEIPKRLPPGAKEEVSFNYGGPLAQGIWRVDSELLDKNGSVFFTKYSAARFSVDNFDDTVSGVGYKSVPMRFSLTSTNEVIILGQTGSCTAHLWNDDNVRRNITVRTSLDHLQEIEETRVTLEPGGCDSVQRDLAKITPGTHTLWAKFFDENGDSIGCCSKVLRVTRPRVELGVSSPVESLTPGETFPVTISIRVSERIAFPVNVLFHLLDPGKDIINEKMHENIPVDFGEDKVLSETFDLPDQMETGNYQLLVMIYHKKTELIRKGITCPANLEGEVSGTLLDAVSGESIPGATMALDHADNFIRFSRAGYFSGKVKAGFHTLFARAPGYHPLNTRVIITASQNTHLENLLLEPINGKVSGSILDVATGKGIEGVEITLASQKTKTGNDGQFHFQAVPSGRQTLQCTHPAYHPIRNFDILVYAGRNQSLSSLALHPFTGILTGRVVNHATGKPIEKANVEVERTTVETDSQGRFCFNGLKEGKKTVYFSGHIYKRRSISIDAAAGRETNAGDLYLAATHGTVSGQILDSVTGKPLENAAVKLPNFPRLGKLATDQQGRFTTPPLPRGCHYIQAEKEEYHKISLQVPVFPERESKIETLWLTPLHGQVRGVVKDSVSGKPLANAEIIIDRSKTVSDDAGTFFFASIPPGWRLLRVNASAADRAGYPRGNNLYVNIYPGKITGIGEVFLVPAGKTEKNDSDSYLEGVLLDVVTGKPISDALIWPGGEEQAIGGLRQESRIYTSAPGVYAGTRVVTRNTSWQDYCFSLELKAGDQYGVELLFRRLDEKNYCRVLMMNRGEPFIRLERAREGKKTTLDEKPFKYPQGKWFRMEIRVIGGSVMVRFGDKILFNQEVDYPMNGGVGLGCYYQRAQWFRRIRVETPEGETLLAETFNQGLEQWNIIDIGDKYRPSRWLCYPNKQVKTDDKGKFSLDGLTPGSHEIHFRKPGYGVPNRDLLINCRTFAGKRSKLELMALPLHGVVEGKVRDAVTLEPLPGVVVSTGDKSKNAVSKQDGTFSLIDVPAGKINLFASISGYSTGGSYGSTGTTITRPGGKTIVDIYMEPQYCSLDLEVRDQVTDEPVPGAAANVSGTNLNAVSGEAGLIRFREIPPGQRHILLTAHGYRSLDPRSGVLSFAPTPGGKKKAVIYLEPTLLVLKGSITGIDTGEPLKDVQVYVDKGRISAVTNRAGCFTMAVPGGKHRVYLVCPGYTAAPDSTPVVQFDLRGGGEIVINTFMTPTAGKITGVIKDSISDAPIARAQLSLDSGWIHTAGDDRGRFELPAPPGLHKLYIRAAEYSSLHENGFFLETGISPGQHLDLAAYLNPGLRSPVIHFSDLPENLRLKKGKTNRVKCRIKNTGSTPGTAKTQLLMTGIGSFEQDRWVDPGEEVEVSFAVPIPGDFLASMHQEACFILGDERRFISIGIDGLKVETSAHLDKRHYEEGETAGLDIRVENAADIPMDIFALVRFHLFSQRSEIVTLKKEHRFHFDIPVTHDSGKVFYGIYSVSSRALVLDTLYIYPKQDTCQIRCDKQTYRAGDTLKASITLLQPPALKGIKIALISPESKETVSETKTIDMAVNVKKNVTFKIPGHLESGTYVLHAELQEENFEYSYPVDVKGISVLTHRVDLNRDRYDFLDDFAAEFEIEADRALVGELECKWLSPQNVQLDSVVENVTLIRGLNRLSVSREFKTAYSGSHSFAYCLYETGDENNPGDRRLLSSGSKLFDVAGSEITALITDRDDLQVGESTTLKVIMHGQGAAELQVLLNGKEIVSAPVSLKGRTVFETDIPIELPGRNIVFAALSGETVSSLQRLCITGVPTV